MTRCAECGHTECDKSVCPGWRADDELREALVGDPLMHAMPAFLFDKSWTTESLSKTFSLKPTVWSDEILAALECMSERSFDQEYPGEPFIPRKDHASS